MCIRMSGSRKLSRWSSNLHASSSNCHRGRWINLTFQAFLVVVWAHHPELIPIEVGCSIPKLVAPFIEVESSLFIRSSEVVRVTSCTSVRSFVSWRCTTSTLPAALRKMVGLPVRTPARRSIWAMCRVRASFGHGQGSTGSSPVQAHRVTCGRLWPQPAEVLCGQRQRLVMATVVIVLVVVTF
jgi:hypothetical protein